MILRNVIGMGFRVGFGVGCGLAFVFSTSAHDAPLPPLCKNPRAERVTIGTFKFSETELVAYAEKNRRDASDACSAPTGQGSRGISTTQREEASGAMPQGRCGIVDEDDPYHDAFEYISLYCKSISKPQEQPSFRVSSPNSFNATAHHKIYRFADAPLAGSCYVCRVPKPARPPKEERKGD